MSPKKKKKEYVLRRLFARIFPFSLGKIQPAAVVLMGMTIVFPLMASEPADRDRNRWQTPMTLHYTMSGRVRLLLFWVGRENVGRGTVRISGEMDSKNNRFTEWTEVLFGTLPGRVPGGINRWGYGKESAQWIRQDDLESTPVLECTRFHGIMHHSGEESLSQVTSGSGWNRSDQKYRFDGIESVVNRNESYGYLRYFAQDRDVDISDFQKLWGSYRKRGLESPPDKTNHLSNQTTAYSIPYGFLSCLREMSRSLCRKYHVLPEKEWLSYREVQSYVYNAKHYDLSLLGLQHHRQYRLSAGEGKERAYAGVAEAEFQIRDRAKGNRHKFILFLLLEEARMGIPIRIVDQPRWWLRVELQLVDTHADPWKEKPSS